MQFRYPRASTVPVSTKHPSAGTGTRTAIKKHSTRGRRFPAEPLTPEEVKRLLRCCSKRAPTGLRNAALIVVLWRGGLRVSEALNLYPKDLDVERGTLRVLHGKGDRSRLVGIDPEAVAVLQRWIDKRTAIGLNGRHPLFCTLGGGPLATVYARNLLKRLARKAGIEKRVHPHGLRHSHAYDLASEGHPLHVIREQLGHSSLATTDRYVRHLNPQQIVAAMQSRDWK
jgi:site-specific recombinase XerD